MGPTAIGKTSTAIRLAEKINAEIISADSIQIYKNINIGSAKPTKEEQKNITHHLIDIKNPNETFSGGEFVKYTENIIKNLQSKNKNAIIVGGGGFYIDSLVFGIDKIHKVTDKTKRFFDDICKEFSAYYLYNLLKIVDEQWASSIKPQDCQRVKRGLSVYFDSGKTLSSFFSKKSYKNLDRFCIFVLCASKRYIDYQIEIRVDKMEKSGLVEEVKRLVKMGYAKTNALNSIGYKEILSYIAKEVDKHTAIELIKKNTKAYAKRQMTLLKSRFGKAIWIDVEKSDPVAVILDVCKPFL